LGELTQVLDFALVDAVAAETGTMQKRVRLLPTRVTIFFVLALALFEKCGYRQVWGKLVAGLDGLALKRPTSSALTRARRRVGAAPLRALFEAVAGPVATPGTPGAFWRGLRLVAIDGTLLHVPDVSAVTARFRKRRSDTRECGYPLLRLGVLVECGTRAVLGAVFDPERRGEKTHASTLLALLRPGMLLLADAGYDSWRLLADAAATGAHYLCRSGAVRTPLVLTRLSDGSYLSVLGNGALPVRIIEAALTVTYTDGTVTCHQWRLITSLLDPVAYPAADLVTLYHERWQIETTFYSIKHTMLDGRVLRSHRPAEIDQEIWALLTVYQAIVRITLDAVATQPGLDPDRASFTVAIETARNQVIMAAGVLPVMITMLTAIGAAVLDHLHPAQPRQRIKARTRKNPVSKYNPNARAHPRTTQHYTVHTRIVIFEAGLTARQRD
jgi:hypothetical protein